MNKTWKETTTNRLRRKIHKHKYFKLPWQIALIVVTIVGDTGEYLIHNSKRFSSIAAVFFVFYNQQQLRFSLYTGRRVFSTGLQQNAGDRG